MLLDSILPPTLDPTLKMVINILVIVHLLAFFCYLTFLVMSFRKTADDDFKDDYNQYKKKHGKSE